jgi:hypothetical protein
MEFYFRRVNKVKKHFQQGHIEHRNSIPNPIQRREMKEEECRGKGKILGREIVWGNLLKKNFLRLLSDTHSISQKALVVNFTCLRNVNTELKVFNRPSSSPWYKVSGIYLCAKQFL